MTGPRLGYAIGSGKRIFDCNVWLQHYYVDIKQYSFSFDYAVVQLIEEGYKYIGAAIWLFFLWAHDSGAISRQIS